MTKQEFESRIGGEVTPEEYDKIQTVYVHYPGIEDKDHIARLRTELRAIISDIEEEKRVVLKCDDCKTIFKIASIEGDFDINDYYAVCPKCGNTRQLKEA